MTVPSRLSSSQLSTIGRSKEQSDALLRAETLQTAIAAQQALADAAGATIIANGKNKTYYQIAAPSSGLVSGDLWFDTDDNYKPYRWDGTTWQPVRDIAPRTFFQGTTPTALAVGDLWFDTAHGFKPFRWDGTSWVAVQDSSIATAQATADGKNKSFYQISAPSASAVGDLWFDTDDGFKPYRWDGTTWQPVRDSTIATAQTTADGATTIANGKNKTFYQISAPTASAVGDLWFDTDDNYKPYRWDGTSWLLVHDASPIPGAEIQNGAIVTAHMTVGTINGDRVTAGTLDAAKIVAGSIDTTRMSANTINGDRILAGTLDAGKIVAGSVDTTRMSANTINGDRITAGTLQANKIVAGSISATELGAGSVIASKIQAGAIFADKITAGEVEARKLTGIPRGINLFLNPTSETAPPATADLTSPEWAGRTADPGAFSGGFVRQLSAVLNAQQVLGDQPVAGGAVAYPDFSYRSAIGEIVPAMSDEFYFMSARVRATQSSVGTRGGIGILFLDKDKKTLAAVSFNGVATVVLDPPTPTTWASPQIYTAQKSPAGTAYALFYLWADSNSGAVTAQFDSIFVSQHTESFNSAENVGGVLTITSVSGWNTLPCGAPGHIPKIQGRSIKVTATFTGFVSASSVVNIRVTIGGVQMGSIFPVNYNVASSHQGWAFQWTIPYGVYSPTAPIGSVTSVAVQVMQLTGGGVAYQMNANDSSQVTVEEVG